MEGVSKRISKVIHLLKSLGIQQIVADGGHIAHPLCDRKREIRQTFSRDYEGDLVRMDENIKKLVEFMVKEENIQVVSITGMGGIGKTTLARQIFNHERVEHHFDGLAWACVSQEFTRKYVWQAVLQSLRPKEDEKKISEMTESRLQGELYQLLGTSKSLIVLDDIWKEEDWDLIKKILPPEKGWKVLLTSRKKSIAGCNDTRHINFQSECLSSEHSWTLLRRIAFAKKELKVDEDMENMAQQMTIHCGGLPLAVKVLGGLLVANYTMGDWKRIYEGIRSRILGGTNSKDTNNGSVDHVLSLSFEELPNYLKHCFLYLAHFPEDHKISVEQLSYYLAVEEIPKPSSYYSEASIQNVGNSYIEELVRRNMVISERHISSSRFRTCHLHDMMREICLSKAKEENFLQIVGIYSPNASSQSHSPPRRLVSHNPTTLPVERDLNNPKLRSLLIVMGYNMEDYMLSCSRFTRLHMLRVLDLSRAEFKGGKLPSSIGKLVHLRYLSLYGAYLSHLPSSLRNLKLLVYLNITIYGNVFVPNFLMEMQELRYLALPWHMHEKTKLELSNLVNLETLKNYSTTSSNLEGLHGTVKLRNLTVNLNDGTSIQSLSTSIAGLRLLEHFSIENYRSNKMIEEVFVLDFNHLTHLEFMNIRMPKLPNEQQLPSHLTYLILYECQLEEDPMPILEKLRHLEVVYLWSRSFRGKRMVCSAGGFPRLQKLELDRLYDLEEWIIDESSIQLLRTLDFHECWKLKELPGGLRFIDSLKELRMNKEWAERLSKGGQDYYKIQHIPSVKFGLKGGSHIFTDYVKGDHF